MVVFVLTIFRSSYNGGDAVVEGLVYTQFLADVMVGSEVHILIGMCWFAVHRSSQCSVLINMYQYIQERYLVVGFCFSGEFDAWVLVVEMLEEIVYVVIFENAESVVDKTFPYAGGFYEGGDGFSFEVVHKNVCCKA